MSRFPLALTFADVLLQPQRSSITSRRLVSLKTRLTSHLEINFPVIATNMDCVTGVDMAIAIAKYGGISFYPRFTPPPQQAAEVRQVLSAGFLTIPAIGIKPLESARADLLYSIGIRCLLIDIAHAHQDSCLDFLRSLKRKYRDLEVIAGTIATYEGARDLFRAGADAVRVGIGSGSICTTRIVTGSGVPQITAILAAARAGREFHRPVIADAGMKNSGDIVKALAAGASAVSTGNLLAGASETPSAVIEINGQSYKPYNGSTSLPEKHRQLQANPDDKSSEYIDNIEGTELYVPYQGSLESILRRLEMGLRSGFTYSGAATISELHQKARFLRVTPSIVYENSHRLTPPSSTPSPPQ